MAASDVGASLGGGSEAAASEGLAVAVGRVLKSASLMGTSGDEIVGDGVDATMGGGGGADAMMGGGGGS